MFSKLTTTACTYPNGAMALRVHLACQHERVAVGEVRVCGRHRQDEARLVLDIGHEHVTDLLLHAHHPSLRRAALRNYRRVLKCGNARTPEADAVVEKARCQARASSGSESPRALAAATHRGIRHQDGLRRGVSFMVASSPTKYRPTVRPPNT